MGKKKAISHFGHWRRVATARTLDLKGPVKSVLSEILNLSANTGYSWAKHQTIADAISVSPKTVSRACKLMEELRYIRCHDLKQRNGLKGTNLITSTLPIVLSGRCSGLSVLEPWDGESTHTSDSKNIIKGEYHYPRHMEDKILNLLSNKINWANPKRLLNMEEISKVVYNRPYSSWLKAEKLAFKSASELAHTLERNGTKLTSWDPLCEILRAKLREDANSTRFQDQRSEQDQERDPLITQLFDICEEAGTQIAQSILRSKSLKSSTEADHLLISTNSPMEFDVLKNELGKPLKKLSLQSGMPIKISCATGVCFVIRV
ncbi:MAG: hypothetical protein Hens3KO_06360 [Henriciella sp.]